MHLAMKLVVAILFIGIFFYGYVQYTSSTNFGYEVKSISLQSLKISMEPSFQLNLRLLVKNPNPVPIYITDIDYDLYINGIYTGKGNTDKIDIAKNSEGIVEAQQEIGLMELPLILQDQILSQRSTLIELKCEGYVRIFRFIPIPLKFNFEVEYK